MRSEPVCVTLVNGTKHDDPKEMTLTALGRLGHWGFKEDVLLTGIQLYFPEHLFVFVLHTDFCRLHFPTVKDECSHRQMSRCHWDNETETQPPSCTKPFPYGICCRGTYWELSRSLSRSHDTGRLVIQANYVENIHSWSVTENDNIVPLGVGLCFTKHLIEFHFLFLIVLLSCCNCAVGWNHCVSTTKNDIKLGYFKQVRHWKCDSWN